MNAREQVAFLVDDGAFEELLPNKHSSWFLASARVAKREVYVVASSDRAVEPLPAPPPNAPAAEQPAARHMALESRRLNELFDFIRASPRPLVLLAGNF